MSLSKCLVFQMYKIRNQILNCRRFIYDHFEMLFVSHHYTDSSRPPAKGIRFLFASDRHFTKASRGNHVHGNRSLEGAHRLLEGGKLW